MYLITGNVCKENLKKLYKKKNSFTDEMQIRKAKLMPG